MKEISTRSAGTFARLASTWKPRGNPSFIPGRQYPWQPQLPRHCPLHQFDFLRFSLTGVGGSSIFSSSLEVWDVGRTGVRLFEPGGIPGLLATKQFGAPQAAPTDSGNKCYREISSESPSCPGKIGSLDELAKTKRSPLGGRSNRMPGGNPECSNRPNPELFKSCFAGAVWSRDETTNQTPGMPGITLE